MPADRMPHTWKDMERDGWQRNARGYDAFAGQMTITAVDPALRAVEARPGMRLLDVCCGPGYAAGAAAARGLTAVGIDLVPAMVDEARRRHPAAAFREGDAEALDFPDASFDAVICAFGLLHLPDSEKAIAEAFRVLDAGGLYAFTVWGPPQQARLLALALDAIQSLADMTVPLPPAPPMFKYSDPVAARSLIENAGFEDVAVEQVPIEFVGRTPEDVFDWFDQSTVRTMALYRLQTPEVQQQIKAGILKAAETYTRKGEVRIPCPALLYRARKP